ncbi:MAG: DUF885 domain-containing protein [Lachnospiraceae bacterium]|nr:DUF885 domain-containing protein [Lachnospiraceae bacterium]
MKKKRYPCFYVLFSLLLSVMLSACSRPQILSSSQSRFVSLCDELFREELSRDAVSLHFALADPASLGIVPGETLFPSDLRADRIRQNIQLENTCHALRELDPSRLDAESALAYEIILSSLQASLGSEDFIYLQEPFSATHGVQSEYPLLLSEYAFRNEDDVRQYLKLLEHTPDYFESLLALEQERTAAGYPLCEENAAAAIAACDDFAAADDLFIQTFAKRLRRLTESGALTAQKATEYEAQNSRLVSTVVLPAFMALGDGILVLMDDEAKLQSLYHQRGGREYYRYLLAQNVGTDKDVGELKLLLSKDLKENLSALHSLLASKDTGQLTEIADPLTALSPAEILEDLKKRMIGEFPMEDAADYPYEVHAVDEWLEPYTAPAYYFTPPMDQLGDNHIYINESQTSDGLNLYTTLAHEGFPGHLYQAVTTQRAFGDAGLPMLRGLISYGGYVEGYATYTELHSYQYAKACAAELLGEENIEKAKLVSTLYDVLCYDRRIKLCLYCLLDIKIHGEGQSRVQIASYLNSFGISDRTAAGSIYDYILNEPTTYLKYYVGYLEFTECRHLAMQHWGDRYSDAAFHTFLLKIGPAPFPTIKKAILSGF